MPADGDLDLAVIAGHAERAAGEVVTVGGQDFDGDFQPVVGALVEIWQANTHGPYHHEADPNPAPEDPAFEDFGQVRTECRGPLPVAERHPGGRARPGGVLHRGRRAGRHHGTFTIVLRKGA